MVTSITGVNGEAGATVGSVDETNTTPITAGTYLTDTWSFTGGANYKDIAATTITDVINKAAATLKITPYDLTYDGNPHTATATATGVKGEDLSSLLTLAGTTHTSAGDYPNDAWSFAGNNNYNTGSATVHDHISKAEATISVTPYTVTYDGNPHSAAATATGVKNEDLSSLLTLTGTTHIDAGDYTADTWSFSGNNNYNAGSSTVHDHINKADANISVTAYGVIYDGNAHTATATATGVKNEDLSSLLSLAGTIHTNAGDYPNDAWSFAGSGNYNGAAGAVHDQISKAYASISVTPYTFTYDGNTHTATASANGVIYDYDRWMF